MPQKYFLTHSKMLHVTYTLSKMARQTRNRENVLFIFFVKSTGMTTLLARNPKEPAGKKIRSFEEVVSWPWPLVVEKLDYWIYGLSLISSNVVGQNHD